jgi:hypothetical protein
VVPRNLAAGRLFATTIASEFEESTDEAKAAGGTT